MPSNQIVHEALTGAVDDSAPGLGRVFALHGAEVWRAVMVITNGRREIADDVTAEAFARALRHEATIRDPLAWIFRTAYRLAGDELRRERRLAPPAEFEPAAHEVDPGLSADVVAALGRLSPGERCAVYLHHHRDMPVRDVAAFMGCSPATVRVQLHRGRARLRALLEREGSDG